MYDSKNVITQNLSLHILSDIVLPWGICLWRCLVFYWENGKGAQTTMVRDKGRREITAWYRAVFLLNPQIHRSSRPAGSALLAKTRLSSNIFPRSAGFIDAMNERRAWDNTLHKMCIVNLSLFFEFLFSLLLIYIL